MTAANAAEDPPKSQNPEDRMDVAVERYRTTAKGMVASFGAVAAALLAALKLSDFGDFTGTEQWVALAGAVLGMVGTIGVIAAGTMVLTAGRVALADLIGATPDDATNTKVRKALDDLTPSAYAPFHTAEAFVKALDSAWTTQSQQWYARASGPDAPSKPSTEELNAGAILKGLNPLNARLLSIARQEDVRATYERVRTWLVVFALVAATGLGMFAFVGKPDKEKADAVPAVSYQPVQATLDITSESQDTLQATLGPKCNLDSVPVIALSRSDDAVAVVTNPDGDGGEGCEVVQIDVTRETGVLNPPDLMAP